MRFLLTDDYEKRQAARAVPGAWYERGTGWLIEDPTPRAAAVAVKLFPHLVSAYPELLAIREALAQNVRPVDYAAEFDFAIPAPRLQARMEEIG